MSQATHPLLILVPVRDDWDALAALLPEIAAALAGDGRSARIVIVDDSSETAPHEPVAASRGIERVDVLRLRRNVGHQQAIAIGLAHCAVNLPASDVVVMDGDGEDDPADVPRLCAAAEAAGGRQVVFAERTRRAEGLRFRFFYLLYRLLHGLLTGRRIRFGNFSFVPAERVRQLVVAPELWAHFAATVVKSRIPHVRVPTRRRKRLAGRSAMNFVALVVHGFNALAVFGEEVVTRVLLGGGLILALCGAGGAAVAGVRFFTDLAVPGWATYVMAFLAVIFLQTVATCLVVSFVILSSKQRAPLIPERDFTLFVEGFGPYPGSGGEA
jgi:hypothetical protein